MRRAKDLARLARTVRHLRASQLVHRVRLRAQKQVYGFVPGVTQARFASTSTWGPGWPASFRPIDAETEAVGRPSLADNLAGRFELLSEARDLGTPIDWQPESAPQLWRYHLHYFDWAWVLLADPSPNARDAFIELYRSWREASPVGQWDAWSPYVVSLRAWTLCSVAGALHGHDARSEVDEGLVTHARYLRANVEFDVGGNHLMKNLKALIGLGVYLDDERLLAFGSRHLYRQLERQILDDGGHFERSPGYHAQVLADVTDLARLLAAAELLPGLVSHLEEVTERMRGWLAELVLPDGSVPLLNDSVPLSAERLRALGVSGDRDAPLSVLESSGYVILRPKEGTAIVMDVGLPCPPELPAHAQADALSVVLDVDGQPVLVEAGTSTYAPGPRRAYERSTAGHNTIEVDGEDQTEVWGTFRAGRRHEAELLDARVQGQEIEVLGEHTGYRHLDGSPTHRRKVVANPDGMRVHDAVDGEGTHDLAIRWHLAEGAEFHEAEAEVRIGSHSLRWEATGAVTRFIPGGVEPLGVIGIGHNRTRPSPCLEVSYLAVALPVSITWELRFGSDG